MAVIALFLCGITAYLLAAIWMKKKSLPAIPGHFELPIVGHLPFVNLKAPHHTFTRWMKEYGKLFKVMIIYYISSSLCI